jgi:iron complex outermembrane recepter protein
VLPPAGQPRLSNLWAYLLALTAHTAAAQQQSTVLATKDAATPEDRVIVTATRRTEDLQSVPLSVDVVTDEALVRSGALGFADYALTVPGLSYTKGSDGEKQTIRGVSTNQWFEVNAATALYLDEVPMTSMSGTVGPPYNPDPFLADIDRVEVLRGPQGTLFGSSAMGGAIRILTKQPNLSAREAALEARISSTKDGEFGYGLHGVYNHPFRDGSAAVRALAYQSDVGGYIDNLSTGEDDVNNEDVTGARVSSTFLLSDSASITARFAYQDRRTTGSTREEPTDGQRKQSRLPEPRRDEWMNYNVVADVDFGWGTLIASASELDRDSDLRADVSAFTDVFLGTPSPLTVVNGVEVSESVREVRLLSHDTARLTWLAGLFRQEQRASVSQDFPSPGFDAANAGQASLFGPPDNLFVRREQAALQQSAVYGELAYRFGERLELTAGGRWFDIERDFSAAEFGLLFVRGSTVESGASDEAGMTPKLSLTYTRSERVTFYGTAAKGFRPGGPNMSATDPACLAELATLGLSGIPPAYESDSLWNYEIGAKSHSSDGRLRINAAAYHIDWSDMQTDKFLRCGVGYGENAGEADVDGAEIELTSNPVDRLELTFAASVTHATLSEDVANLGGTAGDRVPGVPRGIIHGAITWNFTAFGTRKAFLYGDYQHVGGSYTDFARATSLELPAYSITNVRVGVNMDRRSIVLFVTNVFDERGIVFAQDNILGHTVAATRPRMLGASATWNF